MIIKNQWYEFKISNLTHNFNDEYYSPEIEFDFEVLYSYSFLEKTSYQKISMTIDNNLPYQMMLKRILQECENIIEPYENY